MNKNRFVSILFLCFIVVMMLSILRDHKRYRWAIVDNIEHLESYTLDNISRAVASGVKRVHGLRIVEDPATILWTDIYGGFYRLLSKNYMNANGTKIIRLKNDYLTFVGESLSDSELETNVRAMCELKQFLDEHKIPLLYVQFPHKVHRRETQLPFHFQPVANENADRLLTALRAQGIDCYDMRELLDENPDLHYALFWRGDHHWRNEYTLLAGRRLGEILTTQYHFENSERFWSQENYHQETEAFNWAHTSQVTKTGRFFALRDVAHTHYVPKFPTDIHEEPIGCQKNNVRYSNRLASSGKKIFLIHDSFSNQTLCNGLAFSCQELTLANVHNGDRMSDLIDTIKPDIVIVAYWAGKIIPEMFAF